MKYCKRCLYPENHALNLIIDKEGICSGCRVHEEKFTIDWEAKEAKLIQLLDAYRSESSLNYDCIIPVSGAKDSYFIVDLIKNKYKLNPLLVSYNKHYNSHVGNRNLAYLKTIFNCDAVELIVQPQKVKKITRVTLEKMGSIYWHILAGETVFPVQIAVKYKIPLIIWGAHQGLDQVGMFSHHDEVEMTRKYRKEHDLMGYEAEDLLDGSSLEQNDIEQYVYPHDKEIEQVGVRGIYLGNYIPWDTKAQHEKMIEKFDYETMPQQRSFDLYNHVDCFHYLGLHDYIKYLKFGYSKINDHVAREIRWGRLHKREALKLIQRYQSIQPEDLSLFLQWLDISEAELFKLIDAFKTDTVFSIDTQEYSDNHLQKIEQKNKLNFILTKNKNPKLKEDQYTLIEKAYL